MSRTHNEFRNGAKDQEKQTRIQALQNIYSSKAPCGPSKRHKPNAGAGTKKKAINEDLEVITSPPKNFSPYMSQNFNARPDGSRVQSNLGNTAPVSRWPRQAACSLAATLPRMPEIPPVVHGRPRPEVVLAASASAQAETNQFTSSAAKPALTSKIQDDSEEVLKEIQDRYGLTQAPSFLQQQQLATLLFSLKQTRCAPVTLSEAEIRRVKEILGRDVD